MEKTEDKLTKRNLWTYTLGSIGRDTAVAMFSGYLLTFVLYTKTLTDLQFSLISMAMIVGRIIDGFTSPLMGNILDVTRTKWGKFKPWIAIGMLICAVIYYISFTATAGGWSYVTLFVITYLTYCIVFNMNDISYWGMLPSLASQKEDRDRLSSRAVLFAGIGGAIATIVVPTFTAGDLTIGGSAPTAYAAISAIFIALFLGTQTITLLGVKEKPLPPKGTATVNKVGIKTVVQTMKNNDQLMWCNAIFLLYSVGSGLAMGGLGINYIFFEFGYNGFLVTVFSALGGVASGLIMMFFTPISKRFTRDQLMCFAAVCVVGGSALMLLLGLLVPHTMVVFKFALMMVANLFSFGGQSIFYLVHC